MAAAVIPRNLEAPKCTDQPITDIIKWLKQGSVVRLYNSAQERTVFVFDMECGKGERNRFRVIWVDFVDEATLLRNDRVPLILKQERCQLCTCEAGKRIALGETVSQFTYRRNICDDGIPCISGGN